MLHSLSQAPEGVVNDTLDFLKRHGLALWRGSKVLSEHRHFARSAGIVAPRPTRSSDCQVICHSGLPPRP